MRFIGLIVSFILFCVCAYSFCNHTEAVINWIESIGLLAPFFFLLVYGAATMFFLPTMVLTLAGGAIFGPTLGVFYNLFGATLGATCAFAFSRYWLSKKFKGKNNIRYRKLIQGVEHRGWPFVAVLRLLPIIPFSIVNYGLGLTNIKFKHYIVTTFIFLIPAEIFYTYCGYIGLDVFLKSAESVKHFNYFFLIVILIVVTFKLLSELVELIFFHKADQGQQ
jgi:uncharacterized membrane protein YdjX (TVP38/TMEM64 family)